MERELTKEECRAWITTLRSGEYKQGRSWLHSFQSNSFCCLGVLCEVVSYKSWSASVIKSKSTTDHDLLVEKLQTHLAQMNDEGKSFKEIADYIETNILPILKGE